MNILISGAGVAGLTLAYWLKRHGFTPTLVEKHPSLRTGGYKIDIRGVALNIIQQMDLYSKVVENQTEITHASFIDKQGNLLTEMSADLCGSRLEGVDLEIMRGTLCLLIQEAVGPIETIFSNSITQITEHPDGVEVHFEKGSPRRFDLVIGADGLHSPVRKIIFGPESQFSREYGIYVAIFSIPNFLNLNSNEIEYHSLQKFVNVYRDKADPEAKVALAFTMEGFTSRDPIEQKKLIEKVFANTGWETPRILKEMETAPDFYFDAMAQIHMPSWSKGRVALVGDAAYSATPMSGQGTSIAITGAYVLAGELAQAQGDYEAAFKRYEAQMRPYIEKNQALAKMSAQILKGPTSVWLHRIGSFIPASVHHFFKRLGLKRMTKAANAITLKTYTG